MNSSPARSQISRSSAAPLRGCPTRPPRAARTSSLMPGLLGLAQHAHERQLDVVEQVLEPALADLLALEAREVVDEHGARGLGIGGVDGHPALLDELVERVAAARRVQQVGADLGVVDEVGRHLAERLGVVRDHRPVAGRRDDLDRRRARPRQRLLAARVGAEAPVGRARDQLALGGLGRGRRPARARRRPGGRPRPGAPRARARPARCRTRAAGSPRPRRAPAPPRGAAAGRAAPSGGRSRAGPCGPARARSPRRGRCRRPGCRR